MHQDDLNFQLWTAYICFFHVVKFLMHVDWFMVAPCVFEENNGWYDFMCILLLLVLSPSEKVQAFVVEVSIRSLDAIRMRCSIILSMHSHFPHFSTNIFCLTIQILVVISFSSAHYDLSCLDHSSSMFWIVDIKQ